MGDRQLFTTAEMREVTQLDDGALHRLNAIRALRSKRSAKLAKTPTGGRPNQRFYPPEELLIAGIVAPLVRMQLPLPFVREVANWVRAEVYEKRSGDIYAEVLKGKPIWLLAAPQELKNGKAKIVIGWMPSDDVSQFKERGIHAVLRIDVREAWARAIQFISEGRA